MMSCLRRWSGWGDKTGPGSDRAVFSRCFAVCQGGGLVIPRSATRSHSCFRYLPGCDVRVRPGRSRADFEFRNHRRVSPADKLVPRRGLEPPRPCERQHLKLVRLPIPPPGHRCSSMMVGRAMWRPAVALSTASSDLCQRIELQHIQARSMTGSEGGGKPAFAPFGWLQVSAGSRRASPLGSETPSSAVFSHSSPVLAMSASETMPVSRLSRLRIGRRRT